MSGSSETSREADKAYRVLIGDNFHFMDEGERTMGPTFATYDEAVSWCQTYLTRHLQELVRPGMSAASLAEGYKSFGDDPWIEPEPEGTHFSAWRFVEEIADRVCAQVAGPTDAPPENPG